LYKDGLRRLGNGDKVQRHLCRDCGYRFSEKPLQKNLKWGLNNQTALPYKHQICALEAKNLDSATEIKTVAGEKSNTQQDINGKITEYLWHLKKEGRKDYTLIAHRKVLMRLVKHGANLLNPETVKEVIANEKVHVNTKVHYIGAYSSFAAWLGIYWKPPEIRCIRKIPWIPTETEIDQLIAGFKTRAAIFLMILKETMARCGEIWAVEWKDLNGNVLAINAPEKNSNPRQFKLSDKLTALINQMPRKDKRIFGPAKDINNFRTNFIRRRHYLARKLGNPRIDQITFHTFRHFGATMLYHKTRNILYVQQQLGHRCIENTMIYTQLITFESDEYNTALAKT
jgi:integrase